MIKIFATAVFKTMKAAVSHDAISNIFSTVIAVIGTTLSYLLGGIDYALLMLVGFVLLDYATGLLGAIRQKRLNSDSMYWGIIRKATQFLIVGIGVSIDRLIGNDTFIFRLMVIYFYIGMEGLSILENAVVLGVKVPLKLIEILEQIKEKDVSTGQIKDETNAQIEDFIIKKKYYRKDDK